MAPSEPAEALRIVTVTVSIPETTLGHMWSDIVRATSYWARPVYVGPQSITLKERNPVNAECPEHRLDARTWFGKGLQVMVDRKFHRIGELMKGQYDLESLDLLVQAAIFSDVHYG